MTNKLVDGRHSGFEKNFQTKKRRQESLAFRMIDEKNEAVNRSPSRFLLPNYCAILRKNPRRTLSGHWIISPSGEKMKRRRKRKPYCSRKMIVSVRRERSG